MTLPSLSKLYVGVLLALGICGSVAADLINGQPTMRISGGIAQISFSVTDYTDVTIEVVDVQGQVVRHLGSGVLGSNAPLPFQKNSKSQIISWDLKDNKGSVVNPSNVRVRVRAGLKPTFERTMGESGQTLYLIHGMCVDKDGNLFVASKSVPAPHRSNTSIKVFDREGNYLRTILPFPANLPASKLQGVKFANVPEGRNVPFMYNIWMRSITPMGLGMHQPVLTSDGRMIIPAQGAAGGPDSSWVATIGVDGSVGADFMGQKIGGVPFSDLSFALSPDQRYIYVGGYSSASVFRVDRQSAGDAVPFTTSNSVFNPRGVDTDASGNIYVCDYGHGRIAVFNPSGTLISELPIARPVQVAVHPSGKIYVFTSEWAGAQQIFRVYRLSGMTNPTKEATIEFTTSETSLVTFALDKYSTKPIVWVGSLKNRPADSWHWGDIRKVQDNGTAFQDLGDPINEKNADPQFGRSHRYILVDSKTEEVWWDHFVFNGNTGKLIRKFSADGQNANEFIGQPGTSPIGEPRLGPNDSVLFWGKSLQRFKRDGTRYPFSSTGTHSVDIPNIWGGPGYGGYTRGIEVDDQGNAYVVSASSFSTKKDLGFVCKFNEAGVLMSTNVIRIEQNVSGIAVDKKGSIYLGAGVKEYGHLFTSYWQAFFDLFPSMREEKERYEGFICSLVKFPASGGYIKKDSSATDFQSGDRLSSGAVVAMKGSGVEWTRQVYAEGHGRCNCEVVDMETDGHNRVFMPDPSTYSIWIYDENGNQIIRLGDYGNMDSAGAGSTVPSPEIPLSYGLRVGVSDKAIYINDTVANRVVKVRLDYQEDAFALLEGTTITDIIPPTAPTGLTATVVSPIKVNLSWGPSSDNSGSVAYKIYREGVAIAVTSETAYSDTPLNILNTYSYKVAAFDAAWNESAPSNVALVTTPGDQSAPSVSITSPTAGTVVSGIITITANASDDVGVRGVRFRLGTTVIGEDTLPPYSIAFNTATVTNKTYSINAIARDGSGKVTTSSGVSITVKNGTSSDTTAPSMPTSLMASAVSSSQINLSWNPSSDNVGVTGYKIYRGGTQIGTVSGASYSDSGLSAETTYSYRVAAYDATGNTSPQSASVSATTTSGMVADTDADGLPDSWEIEHFGSISNSNATASGDPDGDGMCNSDECTAGTLPLSNASRLSCIDQTISSSGVCTIHWQSVSNKTYQVESSSDLMMWVPESGSILANSATTTWSVNVSGLTKKFYRVKVP